MIDCCPRAKASFETRDLLTCWGKFGLKTVVRGNNTIPFYLKHDYNSSTTEDFKELKQKISYSNNVEVKRGQI